MPRVHPMCAAMATASHRFLTPFPTEFAKRVHEVYSAQVNKQSDSKPTNRYNPESEDTPPHNPVMGPVVGTTQVKFHDKSNTVSPEVGKRYVCRNGVITPPMKSNILFGRKQPYFFCEIDGMTTYWGNSGRCKAGSQDDLIAEYREPEPSPPAESVAAVASTADRLRKFSEQLESGETIKATRIERHETPDGPMYVRTQTDMKPAESPDDWVTQDRFTMRECDQIRWIDVDTDLPCCNPLGEWADVVISRYVFHGFVDCGKYRLEIRCRRKDLPVMPEDPNTEPDTMDSVTIKSALQQFVAWHDMDHEETKGSEVQAAYDKVIDDAKAALQADADKPRMRTIELSEHRYNHSNKMTVWSSRLLPDMYTTGRTAVVEVPE